MILKMKKKSLTNQSASHKVKLIWIQTPTWTLKIQIIYLHIIQWLEDKAMTIREIESKAINRIYRKEGKKDDLLTNIYFSHFILYLNNL